MPPEGTSLGGSPSDDPSNPSNKRKRDDTDLGGGEEDVRRSMYRRNSPSTNGTGAGDMIHHDFSQLQQELTRHAATTGDERNGTSNVSNATSTAQAALTSLYPQMGMPTTDLNFANNATPETNSFNADHGSPSQQRAPPPFHNMGSTAQQLDAAREQVRQNALASKPAVGTEEWHKQRKDNHKEVERRRRETINEGINELAKIVPGCEKNKGSILQRAVSYIQQLKDIESQNIEKWTIEKLLTEQALRSQQDTIDKLKQQLERARHEGEIWKNLAQGAGLSPKEGLKEGEAGVQDGGEG
ncbi:MAG: basic helix-loop-helix protein [Cirrosporium novae-zelandiae]|nr:MAG: basic helix-loop-helix protein [Cirrosporium novae-zelandiae]